MAASAFMEQCSCWREEFAFWVEIYHGGFVPVNACFAGSGCCRGKAFPGAVAAGPPVKANVGRLKDKLTVYADKIIINRLFFSVVFR